MMRIKIRERLMGAFYGFKHGPPKDELTALPTRALFAQRIWPKELSRSQRYGHPLSVAIIDLDDLKIINDRYGHLAGDKALKHLVSLTLEVIRKSDTLIRHGGDEFLLILPESDIVQARMTVSKIEEHIKGRVGATFGVAEFHRGMSFKSLFAQADEELFEKKEQKSRKGN